MPEGVATTPPLDGPRERRRSERLPIIPPDTDARILLDQGWAPLRAMILDLSADGLQALADEPLVIGDRLDFGFKLPDQDATVRVRADVLWVDALEDRVKLWRGGCQLRDVDSATREQLSRFVTEQKAARAAEESAS